MKPTHTYFDHQLQATVNVYPPAYAMLAEANYVTRECTYSIQYDRMGWLATCRQDEVVL